MIFKPKGFFLNLDKGAPATPATVAPTEEAAAKAKAGKGSKAQPEAAAPVAAEGRGLTTAQAIAAELRLEQESRPAPTSVTFAPDRLVPSGALVRRRRLAGANLAGFKEIANSLLKS